MNHASTIRIPRLARAGLALAAVLLLLPAHGHADTLNVIDDTFDKESNPNQNYGRRSNVKVRSHDTKERRGFLKFDLSVLGAATGNDIDTATLRLWIRRVKKAGAAIDIHRVTGPWTEDTLTFATAPGFDPTPVVDDFLLTAADRHTWVLVDVTDLVKGWLDGTFPNHGIAILPVGNKIHLNSKENRRTSHPLEIEIRSYQVRVPQAPRVRLAPQAIQVRLAPQARLVPQV